jgi:hypothetical protein
MFHRELHGGRIDDLLLVDAVLLVHQGEQVGVGADRLGAPQHQKAHRPQGVVKDGHQLLLQRQAQIDQDVAADDQIQLRKRRVARQVLTGKDAHIAHRFVDPVSPFGLDKEPPQPLGRNIFRNTRWIDAAAGMLDGGVAHVGRENLYRSSDAPLVQALQETDGHRIGFFARRTARNPDAHRLFLSAGLQDLGKHLAAEDLE